MTIEEKAAEVAVALARDVYGDAIQPAAREVGQVLGGAVRVALAPVRGLVWTGQQAEEWVQDAVAAKLASRAVRKASIVTPNPLIFAGVRRGLQVAGPDSDPTLRDLFANLLATAMTEGQADSTHPSFAEILAQLTSDEARILRAVGARAFSGTIIAAGLFEMKGLLLPPAPKVSRDVYVTPLEVELSAPSSLGIYWDNLQRLRLIYEKNVSFEWADTQPIAETDPAHVQERKKSWRSVRAYVHGYGVEEMTNLCRDFEVQCGTPPESPRGPRPGIVFRFAMPTTFGDLLLRASLDPAAYRSREVAEIEGLVVGPLDDNQGA